LSTVWSGLFIRVSLLLINGISKNKEECMGKVRVYLCFSVMVAVLIMGAGSATAAPLKTNLYGLDGLFIATGGSTIPAGELALGASMLFISDDLVDGSTLPVSITYGASDKIEVAAAFEIIKSYDDGGTDDSGTGDLFISGKMALQEENADYPATALGLRLKLPMADLPLSSEETDISLFAAMEMMMKSVKGILNLEYILPGGDDENQILYIVGLEIPYSDTTDFSLELVHQPFLTVQTLRGDILNAGATFDMGSALNFGVAVGIGLNDDISSDFTAQGKLTFTF
jgi:hypothetical protein